MAAFAAVPAGATRAGVAASAPGIVTFPVPAAASVSSSSSDRQNGIFSVAALGNGGVVASGYSDAGWASVRLLANGRLASGLDGACPRAQQDLSDGQGGVLMLAPTATDVVLCHLLADGTLDKGFCACTSSPGSVLVTKELGLAPNPLAIAPLPSGRILVVGERASDGTVIVARLTQEGLADPAYGSGGVVAISGPSAQATAVSLAAAADGSAFAAIDAKLIHVTAAGALDPAFAGGAPVTLAATPAGLLPQADRSVLVLDGGAVTDNQLSHRSRVSKYTATGSLDSSYGASGSVATPKTYDTYKSPDFVDNQPSTSSVLLSAPGGGAVVVGIANSAPYTYGAVLERLDGNGTADPAFGGTRGRVVPLAFGGGDAFWSALANLNQTGVGAQGPFAVAMRPGGSLVIGTDLGLGTGPAEGAMSGDTSLDQWGLAALTAAGTRDAGFGVRSTLHTQLWIPSQRVARIVGGAGYCSGGAAVTVGNPPYSTDTCIAVRARASAAALGNVRIMARGKLIAAGGMGFLRAGVSLIDYVPTTASGLRMLRHGGPLSITATLQARDLAHSDATSRARATLR